MLRLLIAGLLLFTLALVGCNSDDDDDDQVADQTATSTAPLTTPAAMESPTPEPPEATPTAEATMPEATAPEPPPPTEAPSPTPEPSPTPTERPVTPLDQVSIALEPVVDGLDRPTGIVAPGDDSGRLFILERGGTIRIVQDGQLLEQPFLDLTERVGDEGQEQGLLGLAFHPDFEENGFFFVNYTDNDGNTHVSRFQVTEDPNLGDPDSEFLVLFLEQPASNHNGGHLLFGPDGYLWIGTGDGGGGGDTYGNGQNTGTLLGAMLRIDPSVDPASETPYAVPGDNPFVEDPNALNEIWAYGLRNPWRYSFDRETGDLYIADVGQNMWEEVNFQPADSQGGENYGWPIMEGSRCYEAESCNVAGLVRPVAEYSHEDGHCSVTGGYVYRGEQQPTLYGTYFYADHCSAVIWGLQQTPGGFQSRQLLDFDQPLLSSFGEDESGELYVVSMQAGTLYRIVAG